VTTAIPIADGEVVEAPKQIITDPGVYFGLDADTYHRSPWLGSTDIRRVLRSAPDFWWHSWLNPMRPESETTPAQRFGHAVHLHVLEGPEAFLAAYAPTDYPGNIKAGMREREEIAAIGKEPLKREDFDRIQIAGSMIRMNPNLATAFSGGAPEVSVFWRDADGIPLKIRLDYLKLRAITDLKSIRNMLEKDFIEACRSRFANARYDIQADHYRAGRKAMKALVDAGAVFGECDRDWLARVAAVDSFAFVFVFWQAEDAPITWSMQLSPGNPILDGARHSITTALGRYQTFMQRFGTDNAWVLADPIQELDMSELPNWFGRAA
jgi:hypothetical protein